MRNATGVQVPTDDLQEAYPLADNDALLTGFDQRYQQLHKSFDLNIKVRRIIRSNKKSRVTSAQLSAVFDQNSNLAYF